MKEKALKEKTLKEECAVILLRKISSCESEAELLQLAVEFWTEGHWLMAAKCYRQAATLGSADAQNLLGECYEIGLGVTRNEAEAVQWYTKAAVQRHGKAMCSLADYYYDGIVVEKDIALAKALLLLSSDRTWAAKKLHNWFGLQIDQNQAAVHRDEWCEAEERFCRFVKEVEAL